MGGCGGRGGGGGGSRARRERGGVRPLAEGVEVAGSARAAALRGPPPLPFRNPQPPPHFCTRRKGRVGEGGGGEGGMGRGAGGRERVRTRAPLHASAGRRTGARTSEQPGHRMYTARLSRESEVICGARRVKGAGQRGGRKGAKGVRECGMTRQKNTGPKGGGTHAQAIHFTSKRSQQRRPAPSSARQCKACVKTVSVGVPSSCLHWQSFSDDRTLPYRCPPCPACQPAKGLTALVGCMWCMTALSHPLLPCSSSSPCGMPCA
jgi:hypothetical protein